MDTNPLITIDPSDLACQGSSLRAKSVPLIRFADLPALLGRMRAVFDSISYAAGIAAVQIGAPVQVAIVNLARDGQSEKLLINPVVLQISGRIVGRREGCLSLPNYSGMVSRRNKITVRSFDVDGQELILHATGYEAAVVQHELDHMNGVMYWDRMGEGVRLRPRV